MNINNRKNTSSFIVLMLLAVFAAAGCGGTNTGGAKAGGTSAVSSGGSGKVAASVRFTGRAGGRQADLTATSTVDVVITISGVYSGTGKEFTPVETVYKLDLSLGRAQAQLTAVPVGVNHLLKASINWGAATETVMVVIPAVEKDKVTTATANEESTAVAAAAVYYANANNIKLNEVNQAKIDEIASLVKSLSAYIPFYEMTPEAVFSYQANIGKPGTVTVLPAMATAVVGIPVQFSAVIADANGFVDSTSTPTWTISGNIGTITSSGVFTATATGSATVTAVSGTITGTTNVTVEAAPVLAVCGNGTVEIGESCDDGNTVTESCAYGQSGCTVCDSTCQNAAGAVTGYCGDGVIQSANSETCDSGTSNGQPNMCNTSCNGTTGSTCGNGITEAGETCDDGNTITENCAYGQTSCTVCGAACSNISGAVTYCGDAAIQTANSETCDDGSSNGQPNMCNTSCNGITGSTCGNAITEAGETCDDGNTVTESCTYGQTSCTVCNSTCQSAAGAVTGYCGDGTTQTGNGETCDDGNTITESCTYGQTSCTVCDSKCASVAGVVTGYCGDGVIQSANGETCDDGGSNNTPNFCYMTCTGLTPSVCGNGVTEAGETCDDGNTVTESCAYGLASCTVCDSTCASTSGAVTGLCGDGVVNSANGEMCDDGNTVSGDGCNSACQGETVTITMIAIGSDHSCALTSTGGVKCWGQNTSGQIGDGTTVNAPYPVDVTGLTSGVTMIASNGYVSKHTCAVTSVGGVKCWGDNTYGQLGNGSTVNSSIPVDVTGLTSGVSSIVLGSDFSCALTTAGGLKCWGRGSNGQLGNGTTANSSIPVDVTGLTSGVQWAAAGYAHACARLTAGGTMCWGYNLNGQLGNNATADSSTPVTLSVLGADPLALSMGSSHTCAVTSVGGLACWGFNSNHEFGDGTTTSSLTPVAVTGLTSGMVTVSTGGPTSLALNSTGGAVAWGYNFDGQLGTGDTLTAVTYVNIPGLSSGVSALAAGDLHSCVLLTSGDVKCMGFTQNNRPLGNGLPTGSLTPVTIIFTSYCGDGIAFPPNGEQCDDGNTVNGDGCTSTCQSEGVCGNGYIDTGLGETCDDGNTVSGDGCSSTCQTECKAVGLACSTNGECCSALCMGTCY